MNYVDEIRRQAEAAPRVALPEVARALWAAFGEGTVTEAEAESLSALIDARSLRSGQIPNGTETDAPQGGVAADTASTQRRAGFAGRTVGSRPRTDASMERRRRWAASGRLSPGLAARFTLAEQAVLALVAAEVARRGDCRLAVGHLAAIVGVAETTVRNAIREAKRLGLLTVEERRVTGLRNDTNIVRIVSPEWTAWLRLARKGTAPDTHPSPAQGRGCKFAQRTPTQVLKSGKNGGNGNGAGLPKGSGRLQPKRLD